MEPAAVRPADLTRAPGGASPGPSSASTANSRACLGDPARPQGPRGRVRLLGVGTRPTPPRTATRGPTPWPTPRRPSGGSAPHLEALGLGMLTTIRGVRATAGPGSGTRACHGAVGGQGHDHGTLGDDGDPPDEPFPLYPDGFPPEAIDPFEREIGREVLGNHSGVGNRDHRRAGRGTPPDRPPDRLHVRRLRLPDRDPQGVVDLATLYEWSRVARRLLTVPTRSVA